MKPSWREILADVRAATAIGRPESIDLALEGLRYLPEGTGNRPLEAPILEQLILPIGRLLTGPAVTGRYLSTLGKEKTAIYRAIAASAYGYLLGRGASESRKEADRLAADSRPDVRQALVMALNVEALHEDERLLTTASRWLELANQTGIAPPNAEGLRTSALDTLQPLAAAHPDELFAAADAQHFSLQPEVRRALVDLLICLAQAGYAQRTLETLAVWAREMEPNDWVIGRVLSASWAAKHRPAAETILKSLERALGMTSTITNARRALERHSA